jgi:hypothetical protein
LSARPQANIIVAADFAAIYLSCCWITSIPVLKIQPKRQLRENY